MSAPEMFRGCSAQQFSAHASVCGGNTHFRFFGLCCGSAQAPSRGASEQHNITTCFPLGRKDTGGSEMASGCMFHSWLWRVTGGRIAAGSAMQVFRTPCPCTSNDVAFVQTAVFALVPMGGQRLNQTYGWGTESGSAYGDGGVRFPPSIPIICSPPCSRTFECPSSLSNHL